MECGSVMPILRLTNLGWLFCFGQLVCCDVGAWGNKDSGMAAIYSLYIINKSGGLIYYKDYGSAGRMDTNDSLRVASLWHSMHAISQQLSPVSGCLGIELLQADTFDLHCFQSLTGTKFFVVSEPGAQHMESLLKFVYELYTDYVLKNPFYEMEMPIRCELFDINLTQAVQKDHVTFLGR
ncbi:hypothetical protein JHK85_050068 [Glycine max]|nr:hypothetical protein JHK86_049303 [Glycine max]KAG4935149.1 hypothetical protein JHK85_050068 [Glycine max]